MKILIFVLALVAAVYGEKINYTGYRVYRIVPTNEHQIGLLRTLEKSGGYDFWTEPTTVGRSVDVMVAPHMVNRFGDALSFLNTKAELIIPNLQERIDQENPNYKPLSQSNRAITWENYYSYEDLTDWLKQMNADHPDVTSLVKVGESYEGREIYALRVLFNQANAGRVCFFETGIHAREWIGPASMSYLLNEWFNTSDPDVMAVRGLYDYYFVLNFNPDGYAYTFSNDRLWRKTRTPYTPCVGADANRNWDYAWGGAGSSPNTCDETYAGPSAFSEKSTKTISDFLTSLPNIVAYINYHSYGQLLLIPYGDSPAHVENYNELKLFGDAAIANLATYYGTQYECGNTVEVLYVASGISMDWVKATKSSRITYSFELRDTGRYGFVLPASQIIPTAIETKAAVITILKMANP